MHPAKQDALPYSYFPCFLFALLRFLLLGISLVFLSVLCVFPSACLGVRRVGEILDVFEGFSLVFHKTKEKKGQGTPLEREYCTLLGSGCIAARALCRGLKTAEIAL